MATKPFAIQDGITILNGNVTFPDGSIQTTAYPGDTNGDANVWVQTFETDAPTTDIVQQAVSVEYDGNGNIIALFIHYDDSVGEQNGSTYYSVGKYTATGTKIWTARLLNSFYTDGWGLAVDTVSNWIYVAGVSNDNEPGDYNLSLLTKFDGDDGSVEWSKSYDFGFGCQSPVVDVDSEGNPIVVGYASNETDDYLTTTKIDADDGTVIWSRSLDGQGDEQAYGMAVGPSGEVVSVGYMDLLDETVSHGVTPLTGSTTDILVINRSELSGDILTDAWEVSGTGITGTAGISHINVYNALTGTVRQGSGAVFEISDNGDGTYLASGIQSPGTNYRVGHKIKILGTSLGGATPNNDCIITIDSLDNIENGTIFNWSVTGTAAGTVFATYGPVTGTNYQTGSGLSFDFFGDSNNTYTEHTYNIITGSAGTNYVTGDVVVIPGTQLGGTSPANDLTAVVSVDNGAVTQFNSFSGTQQTTTYRISVTESVDFSGTGTWTLSATITDTDDRMLVVKYNTLGAIQWQRAILFDEGFDSTGADADIDSEGNIYVCGQYEDTTEGPVGQSMSIIKFNSSGVKQWMRRVDGNCDGWTASIVVGSDDKLYLSATTFAGTDSNDLDIHTVLAKYNLDGTVAWQRLLDYTEGLSFGSSGFFGGPGGGSIGSGSNLAVKQGYVAVGLGFSADFSGNPEDVHAAVAQVSASGDLFTVGSWDFRGANFNGTLDDDASEITVVNAGKTDTDNTTNIDVATVSPMTEVSDFLVGTLNTAVGGDDRLVNGANQLVLEANGALTLPSGGTISEGVVTSNPTIQLTPASPDVASQKLVIKGGGSYINTENGIEISAYLNTWEVSDSATFYVLSSTRPNETLYWWIVPEEGGISTTMSGTVELDEFGSGVFNFTVISDAYEFRVRVSPEQDNYDPATVGVQSVLMNPDAPTLGDYHLHLTTGDLTETSIFLGTDDHNVRTTTDGKIQITTPDTVNNVWEFGTDGELTFPDNTVQTTAWTAPNLAFTGYIDYNTDSDEAATFTVVRSSKPLNAIKEIQMNPEIFDIDLDPTSVRYQLEKIVNTPRESRLTLTLASDTTKVWNYAVTHIGRTDDTSSYKGYSARFIRTYSDNASGIIRMVITKGGISQKYWDPIAANDDWYVGIENSSSILAFTIADSTSWIRRDYEQLVKFFESVVDNVIYNGATEITDAEQLRTRFYNNANTLISDMGGNLYYNFRAYNSDRAFANVPLTSLTSTVNAEITFDASRNGGRYIVDSIDTSGAGFQVGQQITLLGSSLDAYSTDLADQFDGTHNATVTVTAVDGSGGITEYTVSGYGVARWASDNIDDGEDDQFDGSNKFSTNVSWTNNRSVQLQYNSGLVTTGENADNFFGTGSKYVISFHKGIVMLAATGVSNSVQWFAITGNSGFDDDGTVDEGAVNIGTRYSLYVRCVSGPEYLPQVDQRYLVSLETTDRYGLIEVVNNLDNQASPSNHIILQSLHEGDFTVKGNDELILTANMDVTVRGGNGRIAPSGSSSNHDGSDVRIYGGNGFENGGDTTKFGEGGNVIIQGGSGGGLYAYTISDMTNASPAVVTVNRPLELPSGMLARFDGMSGLSLSDTVVYYVDQTSATQLTIYTDSDLTIPLDTTGLGSFVSGGIILGKRNGAVDISSLGSFDGDLKLNEFVWPTNYTEASAGEYLRVKSIEGSTPHLEFATLSSIANGTSNVNIASANGNVKIQTTGGNWTFGNTGTTQFPGSKILAPVSESITMQSDQYSQLMWENANVTVAPNMAINSNFYVSQNNATLDIVYRDGSSTQVTKSWYWNADGNITLPTNSSAINYANGQSILDGLGGGSSYGNSNVANYLPNYTGNYAGNIASLTGNVTAGYFIGNGSQLTGLPESYANANVATFLAGLGSNAVSTTGNVSANYFLGNGSQLTGVSYANISNTPPMVSPSDELHVAKNGNDTNGNGGVLNPYLTIGKALTMASSSYKIIVHAGEYNENIVINNLDNITISSVDSGGISAFTPAILGDLTVSGTSTSTAIINVGINNIITHSASGTLYLTDLSLGQSTNIGTLNKTGSGYLSIQNCNLGISSGVTLTNVNITGSGTVVFNNTQLAAVTVNNASAIVSIVNNSNTLSVTLTTGTLNVFDSYMYTLGNSGFYAVNATSGVLQIRNSILVNPNQTPARVNLASPTVFAYDDIYFDRGNSILGVSANATVDFQSARLSGALSVTGNVSANYFIGNGSQLTDITVSTATTAATVTTASQPNITSVGTLSGLTVGPNSSVVLSGTSGYVKANSLQGTDGTQTVYLHYGNVAGAAGINTDLTVGTGGTGNLSVAGTISAIGNVTGNYFIGNGSQLTGVTVSTAATVTTNAQPNITSLGTLSSLSVTGNATFGTAFVVDSSNNALTTTNGSAVQVNQRLNLNSSSGWSMVAAGNISAANVAASTISGSGNITGANILTGGLLSVTGTITGGNLTTGGVTSATGNITGANLITAGLVTAVGNIIAGNINTAGQVSATGNIRSNGAFIASNVSGSISIGANNSHMIGIGNVNNFIQSYVYNQSNTADASADMIVYGSSGNIDIGFMDMGITSNNFSSSYFTVTGKSEGYLFMSGVPGTSGNMVIATNSTGSNNSIEFYVGGFSSDKGGANRPLLLTKALTTVTGNLSVTGNITGNGAGLTNVTVSAAGNIVGTSSNVTLVAGSYSYTFDNTGILTLPAPASGLEGGEIDFTKAASSSLSGSVVIIDQYSDRIRFFEGGGTARGAYIDVSQAAAGVGTLLNNRVSGLVDAGTFVTMDLLKATVTSSGNRGLSLAATTGSFACLIGGTYGVNGGGSGSSGSLSVTTSASASVFSWNFLGAGDMGIFIITDTTNSRAYRITLQIGASFLNNLISIERLV